MYTQCPECGTIFKVTPEVLRVARGVVRCGVCDSTFNAVHYLSEKPSPVSASGRGERLAPRESVPTPTPAGLASLHAQVAAFQAAQPDVHSTGRFAARLASSLREAEHERAWTPRKPPADSPDVAPGRAEDWPVEPPPAARTAAAAALPGDAAAEAARRRDAEIEAAPDAALEFDPIATDWNTVFISPSARPPTTPASEATGKHHRPDLRSEHTHPELADEGEYEYDEDEDDDEDGDEDGEDRDEDAERPAPASPRPDAEAIQRLFRATAAEAADVQQKSAAGGQRGRQSPDPLPAPDATAPADETASETAEECTFEYDTTVEAAPTEADRIEVADSAPWPPVTPESTRISEELFGTRRGRSAEPLTLQMPEPSPPSRGYGIAAVLALLVLAAQGAHYWRDTLAALPVAGPLVQRAYEAIGRPLEPHWALGEFDVKQLGVSSDVPGTLRLLARVQNRATRAQPYPLLRVTLLDRFETKIARREFTPAEYLPSRRRPEGLLPADQRVDADLLLADPGNDAVSFELDLCLYDHNRLRCAQDLRSTP